MCQCNQMPPCDAFLRLAWTSKTIRSAPNWAQHFDFHWTAQWFIWEVCDFTYLGIIHDWDHWSICPWNEVNFKGSGARLTPQNLQTCPRSVPKMTLKKVSREFLNQSALASISLGPHGHWNRTIRIWRLMASNIIWGLILKLFTYGCFHGCLGYTLQFFV